MYVCMLNKNNLSVKKCGANKKQPYLYVQPKALISAEAKKQWCSYTRAHKGLSPGKISQALVSVDLVLI